MVSARGHWSKYIVVATLPTIPVLPGQSLNLLLCYGSQITYKNSIIRPGSLTEYLIKFVSLSPYLPLKKKERRFCSWVQGW